MQQLWSPLIGAQCRVAMPSTLPYSSTTTARWRHYPLRRCRLSSDVTLSGFANRF